MPCFGHSKFKKLDQLGFFYLNEYLVNCPVEETRIPLCSVEEQIHSHKCQVYTEVHFNQFMKELFLKN